MSLRGALLSLEGRPWVPPAGCLAVAQEVHRLLRIKSRFPLAQAGDPYRPEELEGWEVLGSSLHSAKPLELGDLALGECASQEGGREWHAWTRIAPGVWLTSTRDRGCHRIGEDLVARMVGSVLRWRGQP